MVLRYGFNTGLIWSLEATVYAFSWLVLIGMSYGVRTGGHIAANLLVTRFSGNTRMWLGLIATVLCLVYAVMLLIGSVAFLDRLFNSIWSRLNMVVTWERYLGVNRSARLK